MKLALMHIFLNTHLTDDYEAFKDTFQQVYDHGVQSLSISPIREYGEYGELYVTMQIDEEYTQDLLDFMSDSWDGEMDDCMCTAFTSHVFDSHINSLYFQLIDD